jgi:hypothetical protein
MIKRDEIDDADSCLNKAGDSERLFVLLARDPAAPVAIRAWIAERIRLGKNGPDDAQICEARQCADLMEIERTEIEASRRQQALTWSEDRGAPLSVVFSRFSSVFEAIPSREDLSWSAFAAMFSDPVHTPCSIASCPREGCPHKRGPCWSPAVFGSSATHRGDVEAVSLLVFDVDHATDDQIDEVRARIGAHRYLVHSTHSDRPGDRFVRIIIALSRPIARAAWPSFWRAAQQSIAPMADADCSDAARLYFLPRCSRDAGYFVQVNEGSPLDVDALLVAPAFRAQAAAGNEVAL